MQNPKPNKITISQKITVDTYYCRVDFETEQEWEEFLEKTQKASQEGLMEILDGDVDKDDLWSAFHGSKHKVRIKVTHDKEVEDYGLSTL